MAGLEKQQNMSETFEVRDMRHKEKFFVDDEYLNGYAKHLGTTTSMVYFVLCRHADKNQECFPSYEHIADKLGVSDATIKRSIKDLKDWNIISIGKRKRTHGKFLHNSYLLLDKSVWKSKPEVTSDPRSPEVMDAPHQGSPMHLTIGHPRPTKDTHMKDTHMKELALQSNADIPVLIKEFEKTNKACGDFYGNTTQRKALEKLINAYGRDKVFAVINALPKLNRVLYNKATTPVELWNKWSKIEAEASQLKASKQNKYAITTTY